MYTVGAQCTLGRGKRGWAGGQLRVSDARWGSEMTRSGATVPGVFGPDRGSVHPLHPEPRSFPAKSGERGGAAGPAPPAAWAPVSAGPPAASPSLPCRRPPPRGVFPAGTPAPPRGPPAAAAAAAAGTAGVATRPSRRGKGAEAGAAAREGAAFNPAVAQPPGQTRLPVPTPPGAGAGVSRCLLACLGPLPTCPRS